MAMHGSENYCPFSAAGARGLCGRLACYLCVSIVRRQGTGGHPTGGSDRVTTRSVGAFGGWAGWQNEFHRGRPSAAYPRRRHPPLSACTLPSQMPTTDLHPDAPPLPSRAREASPALPSQQRARRLRLSLPSTFSRHPWPGGAVGVVDAYCPSAIPWPVEGSATESLNQTLEAVLATAGQDLDKSWQTSTDDSSSSNGHSMQVDV